MVWEKKMEKVIIEDDMAFPKASVDPKLLSLQKNVTEFVTSVILKHECYFYKLVKDNFPDKFDKILGTTTPTIIQMIQTTTNKFYNDLYFEVQNMYRENLVHILETDHMQQKNPESDENTRKENLIQIFEAHRLMEQQSDESVENTFKTNDTKQKTNNDSLIRWIFEMASSANYGPHILLDKLIRLTIDIHIDIIREDLDLDEEKYKQNILDQINRGIMNHNLLHQLSKGVGDDTEFVFISKSELPFNIIIDKMIQNQ